MNLRLTCSYLRELVTPSLFHDIYLYPMNFSMARLEALSNSLTIAPLVRRLVCMRPQFLESFRDKEKFASHLNREAAKDYATRKEHGSKNPVAHFGYKDYVAGLDEQNEILQLRKYVEIGAVLIAKFANLSAFVLSGSDGEIWTSDILDPGNGQCYEQCSFLQKRYPRIKISRGWHEWVYEKAMSTQQNFISDVLCMLTIARVQVKELGFSKELGLAPRLQFNDRSSVWRHLRLDCLSSLKLTIWNFLPDSDDDDESGGDDYDTGDLNLWTGLDAVLGRILQSAISLTDLSVRFGLPFDLDHFRPDSILGKTWPCLRNVTFHNADIPPTSVAQFLQLNRSLQKLVLVEHELAIVEEWQNMFEIMRLHPSLWVEFANCFALGTMFTVVRNPEAVRIPFVWSDGCFEVDHVLSDELSKFLSHEIDWSGSLASAFQSTNYFMLR